MVQLLLRVHWRSLQPASLVLAGALVLQFPASAFPKTKQPSIPPEKWVLSLEGGRTLTWERNFRSEADVRPNRGFWRKLVDVVAGEPDYHALVRPFSIVTDSHGRVIVTDPGAAGVHVFDFEQHKYKFIEYRKGKFPMLSPQCVAVDAEDNIYVTDSNAGVVYVFKPNGKLLRMIGNLRGGEGYFKRPTGIAVDSEAQRIYVSDTLRDQVFVMDMKGVILRTIGHTGQADGEFYYPTELRLDGSNLIVVDALNFRIQVFDRSGAFQYAIGKIGDGLGSMFRPKGIGVDSEDHLYVVDSLWALVQVFNHKGQLLYHFGDRGTHAGQFQLPSGLFIDHRDHVFVVDSFNRRVQEFQYAGVNKSAEGGGQ